MTGHIPEGWTKKTFERVARIGNGQVSPTEEPYIDFYHIGPENVDSDTGRISDIRAARELGLISGKYLFDKDSIVYSKIRPNLNKVCLPTFVGICSADMYSIWPLPCIDRIYLYQYMRSEEFLRQSVPVSGRTGLPKINREDLNKLQIPVPPIGEQRKIAAILSTWDEAIGLTERLIAALEQRKRGLMQRLLTGEVRFPGFTDEWQKVELGSVIKPISRTEAIDPNKEYRLIGVRWYVAGAHIHEVIPGEQILTGALSRVHEGDILYNKMWVTKKAFGIARKEHDGAYGTSEYPQFRVQEGRLDADFLGYLFHDIRFQYDAACLCRGTTGRARLNPSDFLKIMVRIPSLREQVAIAGVLRTSEHEIELHCQKLEALKLQKTGLMRRLLTGEVRVRSE